MKMDFHDLADFPSSGGRFEMYPAKFCASLVLWACCRSKTMEMDAIKAENDSQAACAFERQ